MQSPYGNYGFTILTANALRTPDKVALSYRGEQITFNELNRRVNRIANALLGLGIKPGQRVGSLLSGAMAIAGLYIAEAKIGVVLAALNPYWDAAMVAEMGRRSKLDCLIYDGKHGELVQQIAGELPGVRILSMAEIEEAAGKASDAEPPLSGFNDDLMGLFYTSGTSGVSKAVRHSHASSKAVSSVLLEVRRADGSVFGTGPIIWGIGFSSTLGAAFYAGMKVALEDDFGPAKFLEAVQRERISHVCMIPSQWADLLANHPHDKYNLDSLTAILLGGEPLPGTLRVKMQARLPTLSLYSFYGQTEAPYSCLGAIDSEKALGTAGFPRIGNAAKTVAADGSEIRGSAGELLLFGPHVTSGYDGQPDKTAESLRDGWFQTGDLASISDEGRITILGRREDAIARGGRFVRPIEIEEAVLAIAGVSEAGAVGAPAGAETQKIILAVSLQAGVALTEGDIRGELAKRLPAGDVPELIVIADELPHGQDASGGRGKLQRRVIRDLYGHLV